MSKTSCKNSAGEKVVGFGEIVETLLREMEQGRSPWQTPWLVNRPRNATTGISYKGINAFWLHHVAKTRGWDDARFLTDKQLRERGGEPVQGSGRKTPIVFWKPLEKPARKLDNGSWEAGASEVSDGAGGTKMVKIIWLIREYYVWNVAQVKIDPAKIKKSEFAATDVPSNELAESLVTGMVNAPTVNHIGNEASYNPTTDTISLPSRESFKGQAEYYGTLLHEATHATGHPSRLNRFKAKESSLFGSDTYSLEELVAEMTAASLVAYCGMVPAITNSAAYLRSWAEKLRRDPRQIMSAAKKAQEAYEFLTGPETVDSEEETSE